MNQNGRRKYLLLVLAGVALAAAAIVLMRRGPEKTAGALHIPILASSALQSLDPIKSAELVQYNLDLQIFECLVAVDAEGKVIPALAVEWTHSEDQAEWTFKLREAKFADAACFPDGKGRAVTTGDVIYSWERGLRPDQGSLNSWALSTIVEGAEAYSKGSAKSVSGLIKIDDSTLKVKLVRPDAGFLTRLTVLSTAVVPREAVEKSGAEFGLNPVGSGPFKVKEWVQGQKLTLARNTAYGAGSGSQPKPPKVAEVTFIFFRSETQIEQAFQDGSIHCRDITGADLARSGGAAKDPLGTLVPGHQVIKPGSVCRLHLLAPMMGDSYAFGSSAELRRALAGGFDHAALQKSALGPLGETTKTLVLPPAILRGTPAGWVPAPAPAPAAGALHGREVRLAFVSSRVADITVELLRDWVTKQGGTLRLFPSASINALFASVAEVKPDLTLIYWSPYFPDLANFLTALQTQSQPVPNFTGFSDARLDAASGALALPEGKREAGLEKKIGSILDETMPWIPLYYETPLMAIREPAKGIRLNAVSVMLFDEIEAPLPGQSH